jgi:hypothetical protein
MKALKPGLWLLLGSLLVAALSSGTARSADHDMPGKFSVAPPPFSEGIFPCSQCHKVIPLNRNQRKLEQMHDEIVLKHMPDGWCFNCHNPENRDTLRLAGGRIIKFEESYLVCGQCHGTVFRDWKVGLHGKRTGMWNGEKQYLLCVNCHSPHDPVFKALTPLPPPTRPSDIRGTVN